LQQSRLNILIHPSIIYLDDLGDYYGISDVSNEEEKLLEISFLKNGPFKIILIDLNIEYPKIGDFTVAKTSFVDEIEETKQIQNGFEGFNPISEGRITINLGKEIKGYCGISGYFRIRNKSYYRLTTEEIKVSLSYQIVFLFIPIIIKKDSCATINPFK